MPDYMNALGEQLRKLEALREERTQIAARDKELIGEIEKLEGELSGLFELCGVKSILPEGCKRSHNLYREVYPKKLVSDEEFFEALRKAGYEHLVRESVNAQTLGAMVREWVNPKKKDDDFSEPLTTQNIPRELRGVLGFYEKVRVR